MSGPFGGAIGSPGGCGCCGSTPCGSICKQVAGCNGSSALYGATVAVDFTTGAIVDNTITNGGSDYTSAPVPHWTDAGGGTGAAGTTTIVKVITALTFGAGGTGYTNGTGYSLSFTGGGGAGASGTFDVVGGAVTNPVLLLGGTNWTSAPTVGFPGAGPGTGASVTATILGHVTKVNMSAPGHDYTPATVLSFTGGAGTGAAGTPVIQAGSSVGTCTTTGKITLLTRTSGGSGYTNGTGYPLSITGGGGAGASGTFDVVSGAVTNPILIDGGAGFTSAPTIGTPGAGTGTGSAILATIRGICCIPISSGGAYTITTSHPSHTTDVSRILMATCTNLTQTLIMLVPSGYVCVSCCPFPIKTTLVLNTPFGLIAATYVGNPVGRPDIVRWNANVTATGTVISSNPIGTTISCASGIYALTMTLDCVVATGLWHFTASCTSGYCDLLYPDTVAGCDPNGYMPVSTTSAGAPHGVSQMNPLIANQPCPGFPFDLIFTVPGTQDFQCPVGVTHVSAIIQFAGDYEYTF